MRFFSLTLSLACLLGSGFAYADGMTAEDKALAAKYAGKHNAKSHKKSHAKRHIAHHPKSVNYTKSVLPAGHSMPASTTAPSGVNSPPPRQRSTLLLSMNGIWGKRVHIHTQNSPLFTRMQPSGTNVCTPGCTKGKIPRQPMLRGWMIALSEWSIFPS